MGDVSKRPRRRKKAWSHSEGEYGHRVRVFEDPNSGIIYGEMRAPSRAERYVSVSRRHRDRARAVRWAEEQVKKWIVAEQDGIYQTPTASRVFSLYLKHRTPSKVRSERDADERRVRMWTRILGPDKDLSKLSLREWQWFIENRRTGAINSDGEFVPVDQRQTVRDGTVAADLVLLLSALNWGPRWRLDDGRYLMSENPARGFPIPKEKNPRRPLVTEDRYQKVLAAAQQVTMVVGFGKKRREEPSYLPEILTLVNGTGRRVSAVLALRAEDLRPPAPGAPHGFICWPAATDKMGKAWTVPISQEVRSAVNRMLERRGIGPGYLFPAPNHRDESVAYEVASAWLLKAETIARVEKHKGSLWHAYRRKWATERKHLPGVDVAAAGGWSDVNTLMHIYQQPDMATMYRVMSEPAKLIEQGAGA